MRSVLDLRVPDTGRPQRQPAVLPGPWRESRARRRASVPIAAGVVALVTLIVLTVLAVATADGGSRGRGGSGSSGPGDDGSGNGGDHDGRPERWHRPRVSLPWPYGGRGTVVLDISRTLGEGARRGVAEGGTASAAGVLPGFLAGDR